VKGITGEYFIPKTLIHPQGIPPLCDDPGLRAVILAWLPTLDKSGVAVCQTGGRDPHRKIQILGVPVEGSQPVGVGSGVPPAAPSPLDKGKGLLVAPLPRVVPGVRRKRGDAGCVALMGHWSRTLPAGPRRSTPRSDRGPPMGPKRPTPKPRAQRHNSPPPPPPLGPPSPQPPPPSDPPSPPHGQQQQQQQRTSHF
jgi:hypothetical protein